MEYKILIKGAVEYLFTCVVSAFLQQCVVWFFSYFHFTKARYTLHAFFNGFLGFRVFASFFITCLGCKNDAKTQKNPKIDAKAQKHA